MNELTMTLDVLLEDLKVSEKDLRSAVFDKSDHPLTRRLESINSTLLYLKDLTSGLLEQIEHDGERVYCIETSTEVTSWVRVHAKNEKDAIRFACNVMEDRIHNRMTEECDIELDTEGKSIVDYGHGKDKRVLNVPYPKTKQNAQNAQNAPSAPKAQV